MLCFFLAASENRGCFVFTWQRAELAAHVEPYVDGLNRGGFGHFVLGGAPGESMTLMLNSFVVRGGRHVRDSGCDSMFGYFCDRGMDSRRCSRCCRPGLCLFQVVSLTLSRPMKPGAPGLAFETWDNTNARAARCDVSFLP
jgi:hypothetical protein